MNSFEIKLIFIIILIFLISFLIYDCIHKSDNFGNFTQSGKTQSEKNSEYLRIPPHQELLARKQLLQKKPIMETQNAPDFKRTPQIIKPNNAVSEPNGIYRQRTGRQHQPIEHYVNIYDSNFGGIIPTSLGLKEYIASKK